MTGGYCVVFLFCGMALESVFLEISELVIVELE